jgi:hypothetical protein
VPLLAPRAASLWSLAHSLAHVFRRFLSLFLPLAGVRVACGGERDEKKVAFSWISV